MDQKFKKAIVAINLSDKGSSGTIMNAALEGARLIEGVDTYKIIPNGEINDHTFCYANEKSKFLALIKEFFYKLHSYKPIDGTYFNFYTKKVIKYIKNLSLSYKKIVVHIHNIHHSQLNVFKLLSYFKKNHFDVVITIHDAWFYTGGCYCYDHVGCLEWQLKCFNCQQKQKKAPKYLNKKIKLLNSFDNLYIVAVSNWVKEQLVHSKITNKSIDVIYGCTDIEHKNFEKSYNFGAKANGKKILLSVSDYWNEWKGINYLKKLSSILPPEYIMVLVGGTIDISEFKNTIHINQISDREELARIYSSANVYVSTSQTETLGLSLCEAQINGCPVVTFGCGGSKETVIDGKSGYIVENRNVDKMLAAIQQITENETLKIDDIKESGNRFSKRNSILQYRNFYYSILSEKN